MPRHREHFKCVVSGCETQPNGNRFCEKHRAQYRRGIIDSDGNQLREVQLKNRFGCKITGCEGEHAGNGFCQKHYAQQRNGIIDENGNQIRELKHHHRPGMMDGYDSQKQRGVDFIMNRYFNGGPTCVCRECKREFEFYQIDGHHPDASKKTISAQQACYRYLPDEPRIVAELDTLLWVCAHCHIVIHAGGDDVSYVMTNKNQGSAKIMDRQMIAIMKEFGMNCKDCQRHLGRRTATFHHRDPSSKVKNISQIIGKYKDDFVFSEVRKCDMICEPCHRKRHMVEDGGSRNVKIDWETRNALIAASPIGKKRIDRPEICIMVGCGCEHCGLGFCKRHLSQYHNGIIDANGNQIRELYRGGFGKLAVMRQMSPTMAPGYVPELNI